MQNNYDNQYLKILNKLLNDGIEMPCRTGNNTLVCLNQSLTCDLNDGFPALTFRPLPFKGCRVELSGFLQGITDKNWYIENGCKYWSEWCNPKKVPYSNKEGMKLERDLGNIYGFNYRHFGAEYDNYDTDYTGKGFDQLKAVVDTLKTNPYDRRMIISAWDPAHLETMALPPCMYLFQFVYLGNRLHLSAKMRSTDYVLGCPTDIMFCALFLHLMAQTVGMTPGTINLDMTNCHIYDNHIESVKSHLTKWEQEQYDLPQLVLDPNANVFNFTHDMAKLDNYQHGEKVSFPIAV